jgi:putative ABC transport system substrate-binding protein
MTGAFGPRLSRRRFVQGASLAGLGLLAACGWLPGQAPPRNRVYRVGYLALDPAHPQHEAFRQGLRELGYVDGQNLTLEYRWADSEEHAAGLAGDLIALPVDVLVVASGTGSARAVHQATTTVPIVMTWVGDPVATGLVASLARPGGNVTGLSSMAPQLNGKRLEMLQAILPRVSRVVLIRAGGLAGLNTEQQGQAAAQLLGIELLGIETHDASEVEAALETAVRWRADTVWADGSPLVVSLRGLIVDFATKHQLPVLGQAREFVEAGGLLSYGPSRIAMFRRAAYYVDRILKGAKPADLPVEQPTTFDLVINLRSAQALGLTIPQHVLLQATEVIQ